MGEPASGRASVVRRPEGAARLLVGLSGFAGLGYEIVWTQQLGIWLGHELVAVLSVLAAFFAGLALGAQLLARRIEASARPGLWYAGCEAVAAGWALLLSVLIEPAGALLATWVGSEPSALRHWSLALLGPLVLLAPATAGLGASLPAMARALGRGARDGYGLSGLYAANTLGAALGVLGCALGLIPTIGLAATARSCAVLSLIAALGALLLFRRDRIPAAESAAAAPAPGLRGLLATTGLLGIGYEVVVVRVLAQRTASTVYTFALLLTIALLGTAAGGALHARWLAARERDTLHDALLAATSAACLLGLFALALSRGIAAPTSSFAAALGYEAALALAAFLAPTVAMGALFSALSVEARASGLGWGPALAANTLGAATAPVVFGVLLVPTLGLRGTLLAIVLGYLTLRTPEAWQRARARSYGLVVLGGALIAGLFFPPLAAVDVPPGGRLVRHRDGIMASVGVVEDAQGVATLHIDNHVQEGSSATLRADARQAWLPLALHPAPHRALFLGLGTGITAGSAAWDLGLEVDAVELVPEVVEASTRFTPALESARSPRVVVADARRYVRASDVRYDVIVADLFHPARSGAGALYTREHFAAVRARLADGGLFCQWLPLHQLDLESLRSIVAAFVAVDPNATALLATNSLDTPVLGLLMRLQTTPLSARDFARLQPGLASRLSSLQLADPLSVLGSFVAGPAALRAFAAGAPINTDDLPVVAHHAPKSAYLPDAAPRARLIALLDSMSVSSRDVLGQGGDPALAARLDAYVRARDRYLRLGAGTRADATPRELLATLRAPLLEIVRISADFSPAYEPLLRMAAALPTGEARTLLSELSALTPLRPEAGRLLERLPAQAARP